MGPGVRSEVKEVLRMDPKEVLMVLRVVLRVPKVVPRVPQGVLRVTD